MNVTFFKNSQPGFSILEFVISVMISTIILTASFTIYNQIGKGARIMQKIAKNDTRVMILHDRLSKDLSGVAPLWFTPEMRTDLKKEENKRHIKDKESGTTKDDKKPKSSNAFFVHQNNNVIDFFTFITTNSMQMYGSPTVRFTRTVYKLTSEKLNDKIFKLWRKQDDKVYEKINPETIKEGSFYELAGNISKFSLEYGFTDNPKDDDVKQSDIKPTFKWSKEWNNKPNDQDKKYQPVLPEAIKLQISFLQDKERPEISYELVFTVPVISSEYPKMFIEIAKDAQSKNTQDKTLEISHSNDQKLNKGYGIGDKIRTS